MTLIFNTHDARWPALEAMIFNAISSIRLCTAPIGSRLTPHWKHTFGGLKTIALLGVLSQSPSSQAHEYWLAPTDTSWQTGQHFKADIRNGENFSGAAYPFDGNALRIGGLVSDSARRSLTGRLGDYPAISFELQESGLHLIMLETTSRNLAYESQAEFTRFLDYHALSDAIASSDIQVPITEHYYRFVKTLFYVNEGSNAAKDSLFARELENNLESPAMGIQGQHFELVVNGADATAGKLNLLLLFDGKPLSGRQVEVFFSSKADEQITRSTMKTDEHGQASLTATQAGDYLVNSVWITPHEQPDIQWKTYWASLTFAIQDN